MSRRRRAFRRSALRSDPPGDSFSLSFRSWDRLPRGAAVVSVCHPDWRGVRVAAYTFRTPVIETRDLGPVATGLVEQLVARRVGTVVVQGFPPGSERFLECAAGAGLATRLVLHSSMAQHGDWGDEGPVADTAAGLARRGTIGRLGFVKAGVAEAFAALGYPAEYVPNRAPRLPRFTPATFDGDHLEIGVLAESFWRKNVVTQLGAIALLPGGRAHVLDAPPLRYIGGLPLVEHGVLSWERFLPVLGGVDLNLYVTLSECHPLTPIESYQAGVPCLISRTSALFRDDHDLWQLTTVGELDNPVAIADAARRLLANRVVAVDRAKAWIVRWDREAERRWKAFIAPD